MGRPTHFGEVQSQGRNGVCRMTRTEIFWAKEITRGLRLASYLREHIRNAKGWSDIQECVKTRRPATCLSVCLRGHCQQGVKSELPVKI
jgi:hypothetical protein